MSIPLAYLGVVLIWSTTPLAMKWSLEGTGFAYAVVARMAIGLAVALLALALWRLRPPLHASARKSYLAGGLGMFGAMSCTYWGAQYIHSGLISVLFGLTPLMTGLLARVWLGERALGPAQLLGMLLGLAGLAAIFSDRATLGGVHAPAGVMALLLAVFLYSTSLVWLKRIGDHSPPLATTAGTLAVALPFFTLVWWLTDGHAPAHLSARAQAAIVYLGVFGSVLGFAFYYYVIKHMETGKVALITLITPVLALLLGHALNGEAVGPQVWLGTGLILGGLCLHQWRVLAGLWRARPGTAGSENATRSPSRLS